MDTWTDVSYKVIFVHVYRDPNSIGTSMVIRRITTDVVVPPTPISYFCTVNQGSTKTYCIVVVVTYDSRSGYDLSSP